LLVLFAVLLGGGILALVDTGGDGEPKLEREGSEELDGGDDVRLRAPARSYRVTYRVRQPGDEPTTETIWVARPFEGRVEARRGDDDNGTLLTERESTFGHLAVVGNEEPFVLVVGPRLAAPDLRLDPVLDEALERGLLERRERRSVAGRVCQVYRAASSVTAGDLDEPGTEDEYADACFDEAGILLEEWWISGGKPIRQRVAVEVETDIDMGAVLRLPSSSTLPPEEGGGGIPELEPDSAPEGSFWQLGPESVPRGFVFRGRYSVVPTQTEAFGDPRNRGSIVASTVDVWVRGPDMLVVEQGATLGGSSAFDPDPRAPTTDLGPLGTAELRLRLDRVEARVQLPRGGFLRVYGTLTSDEIVEVARALREMQGTGLRLKQ
jgi:hypothetical protein